MQRSLARVAFSVILIREDALAALLWPVAHGQMRKAACLHDLHSAVCKCHNILQYDILCHRQKYEDHVATGAETLQSCIWILCV